MGDSLLQIVARQRTVVVAAVLACVAVAVAYLCLATPQYNSTARLYVRRTGPRHHRRGPDRPVPDDNFLFTQREIILSTPVIAMAVTDPEVAGLNVMKQARNPIAWLKTHLDVEVGKKDELVSISFDAPDPREGTRIIDATVQSYLRYQAAQKKTTAAEVVEILAADKKKREAELAQKVEALVEHGRKYGLPVSEGDKFNAVTQRLAALSETLNEAHRVAVDAAAAHEEVAASLKADPRKAEAVAKLRGSGRQRRRRQRRDDPRHYPGRAGAAE